jgi:hypothetical protein
VIRSATTAPAKISHRADIDYLLQVVGKSEFAFTGTANLFSLSERIFPVSAPRPYPALLM